MTATPITTSISERKTPSPGSRTANHRLTAMLPVVGAGVFAAIVIVSAALQPSYSHLSETMSALGAADARFPGLMVIAFFALATGTVVAAVGLRRRLVGRSATVGAVLVGLAGLCLYGAGIFPNDCSPALAACAELEKSGAVSGSHVLHNLVSLLSFVLLITGTFVTARAVRHTPELSRLAWPTRLVAFGGIALLAVFISGVAGEAGGLVQRLFIALVYGWPIYLGLAQARAPKL